MRKLYRRSDAIHSAGSRSPSLGASRNTLLGATIDRRNRATGLPKTIAVAIGAASVALTAGTPRTAVALPGDHNRLPEVCQGVAGAAYTAHSVLAVALPTPFDFPPSAGAYAGNWTLRLCPPQVVAPPDQKHEPDERSATSADPETTDPFQNDPNCYATLVQNRTTAGYNNVLGLQAFPFSIGDWGELGTPDVYHFNTSVDVRILGPRRQDNPATPGDESLADELQTGIGNILRIPVGVNRLAYRADTLVSLLDFPFIYIPKLPPGSQVQKEVVKKSGLLKQAVIAAAKVAATAIVGAAGTFDLSEGEFVVSGFRHGQFGVLDDIYNEDSQSVWVYDRIPPVLTTRTDISTLPARTQAVLSYDAARDVFYLEAIHPGGIQRGSGVGFLEQLLDHHDHCNRQVRLQNDGGGSANFWPTGGAVSLQWTASDPGPRDASGGVNSVSLVHQIEVRDSFPPVLLAPPSQVIEIPAGQSQTSVDLGVPRVFDLADLTPDVDDDAGGDTFNLGLTEVTWTASDGFNSSEAVQLINIKVEGTNTPPTAEPQTVETASFEQTEIILSGSDADFHPSVDRFDPLTFSIVDNPDNGFFVAPLLPYFIEDYRLEASALQFASEPWQQDPLQYCDDQGGSFGPGEPDRWEVGYPFQAEWMAVDDSGNTIVYDEGSVGCTGGSSGFLFTNNRFVIFDENQDIVTTGGAPGGGNRVEDIFWHFDTGRIYATVTDNADDDRIYAYDSDITQLARYNLGTGFSEPWHLPNPVGAIVDNRGILYAANNSRVHAYRLDGTGGDISGEDVFLGAAWVSSSGGSIKSIAVDSDNNLYVSFPDRIFKVTTAEFDGSANFTPGQDVGWLGYCSSNLTNEYACDTPSRRSIGFTCTDSLCGRDQISGDQPGQLSQAGGIAVDPNDVLYVADTGNARVQRFTSDGLFAGESRSAGVGFGFLLGDFGNPDDIEVNSDHFYILNRDSKLLHVFESTPITPIDDGHASVIYQSNNNFVGSDRFIFGVTDGLDSAEAFVEINVSRNFRPPEVPELRRSIDLLPSLEDQPVSITLPGTDPDGNFDVLSVAVIAAPEHGELTFNGLDAIYTPDLDYNGPDDFSYRVFDGLSTSEEIGEVALTIDPVEDAPTVEVESNLGVNVGFRLAHRVDVYDPDSDETLLVTIDWGDGLSTAEGHFELDGIPSPAVDAMNSDGTIRDDVEATGPILSVGPTGRGVLVADHVYTRTGTYNVRTCVSDKAEVDPPSQEKRLTADSKERCALTMIEVTAAGELSMEVQDPQGMQGPGSDVEFIVTLRNLEFDLDVADPRFGELPPTGASILGLTVNAELSPHLELVGATSAEGTCTTQGVSRFDCLFADVSYGAAATITVQTRLTAIAPGRAQPALVLDAEWLEKRHPVSAAGKVEVASSGAAPTLSSISPTSGEPESFTEVTLEGANFENGIEVLFGGRSGTQLRVINSTTLTVLTPTQAEGVVDVTVINPDDQQGALTQAWTYEFAAPPSPPPPPPPAPPPTTSGGGGGGAFGIDAVVLLGLWLWAARSRRRRRLH